jgi:hypothetical protein
VDTVLGLVGFVFFVVCVITFAAGVTWLVVKVSPAPGKRTETPSS